jgi:DNA polymerase-4
MTFCRDCFLWQTLLHNSTCHSCGSPRVIKHNELKTLTIAHIDCDAFYASVEKRDDKTLVDQPLIIGGGSRGVVATACYIARIYGVHSAMPMFKALKACPNAKVIMPNMAKYSKVSKEIRRLMLETTPIVEPISIDEAFLDLTGTERLHQAPAAETLARLINKIYNEVGITASVGLSYNKFLSKVASDLNKPEGFSIIGKSEAKSFLSQRPINTIWGVGHKLQNKLRKDGILLIKDLQQKKEAELVKNYGIIGLRLANFSIGSDERRVTAVSVVKSISTETTFNTDITGLDNLLPVLWRLCETLSSRIKNKAKSGKIITVKFKTSNFKTFTRRKTLEIPTQLAEVLYQSSISILEKEAQKTYRLLGISLSDLKRSEDADTSDSLDLKFRKIKSIEKIIDNIRGKLGDSVIEKGRGFKK